MAVSICAPQYEPGSGLASTWAKGESGTAQREIIILMHTGLLVQDSICGIGNCIDEHEQAQSY